MKWWYKSFPCFLDGIHVYCYLHIPSPLCFNKRLTTLIFHFFQRWYLIMHSENCQPCHSKQSQWLSATRVFFSCFASVQTLYRQISCPCWCSRTHNAVWPVLSNCYKDKPWEPWATTAWESVLNFLWSVPDAACWTVVIESESQKVAECFYSNNVQ